MNQTEKTIRRKHLWRPRTALSYTFTESGRNSAHFDAAFDVAKKAFKGEIELKVLQIGPGAVLKSKSGVRTKTWFNRKTESLARKIPLPDSAYATYEPQELIDHAAGRGFNISLSVIDLSSKVLSIVANSITSADFQPRMMQWDVTTSVPMLESQFDMVICCNVLVHVHEPDLWKAACENLVSYAASRCVIVTDDERMLENRAEFSSPAKHVYLREY